MGQSTPTVTDMLDRFGDRYKDFRAGLPRNEQRLFDRLVAEGHRHTNSLNSYPVLDFERPLFLAFLLGVLAEFHVEQAALRRELAELKGVGHEVPVGRLPAPLAQQHRGVGQARLLDGADGNPVSA